MVSKLADEVWYPIMSWAGARTQKTHVIELETGRRYAGERTWMAGTAKGPEGAQGHKEAGTMATSASCIAGDSAAARRGD